VPTQSKAVEFLVTTKIGEKGQLTVPKQFREDVGFGIWARVDVLRVGGGLVVLPERPRVTKRQTLDKRRQMAQLLT
jgi:bifunctional DNA-binding transcriptional regulator/antitoxin component of YhaV-PrlF toxin-antitoxin module